MKESLLVTESLAVEEDEKYDQDVHGGATAEGW